MFPHFRCGQRHQGGRQRAAAVSETRCRGASVPLHAIQRDRTRGCLDLGVAECGERRRGRGPCGCGRHSWMPPTAAAAGNRRCCGQVVCRRCDQRCGRLRPRRCGCRRCCGCEVACRRRGHIASGNCLLLVAVEPGAGVGVEGDGGDARRKQDHGAVRQAYAGSCRGVGEEGVRMDSCQAIPMLPCILPLEKSQNCYTCMP